MVKIKRTRARRWGLFHSVTGRQLVRKGRTVSYATKKAAQADARRTRKRNR